ncbi:N2,N2-dimethylguanosine tRNA methyltransferase [Thermoplasmatales archaeon AK]|nr:N2,N2-dimethylguanosine tRNA methyltransferase [Thermoplasmatales archaeon AK]
MIFSEGLVTIVSGSDSAPKGPGKVSAGFYNPSQKLNRDITIAFVNTVRPSHFLDAFGGTGVRGIRVLKEAGINVTIAETNPQSVGIIEENCSINGVNPSLYRGPFQKAVMEGLYDFIDLDPYGSIIPYLDLALRQIKREGFVGATATDLSALTGSVPLKTKRRYDAVVCNDRLKHETGVRVLLAAIGKRAAALDRGIEPIISFWKGHYYRLIFRVTEGAAKADRTLENISTLSKRDAISDIYQDVKEGPMWIGPLEDKDFIRRMHFPDKSGIYDDSAGFLQGLPAESLMLWFYEITDFCQRAGTNLPPLAKLMEVILSDYGIEPFRSIFSHTGLKLSEPVDVMQAIRKALP